MPLPQSVPCGLQLSSDRDTRRPRDCGAPAAWRRDTLSSRGVPLRQSGQGRLLGCPSPNVRWQNRSQPFLPCLAARAAQLAGTTLFLELARSCVGKVGQRSSTDPRNLDLAVPLFLRIGGPVPKTRASLPPPIPPLMFQRLRS